MSFLPTRMYWVRNQCILPSPHSKLPISVNLQTTLFNPAWSSAYPLLSSQYCCPVFGRLWLSQKFHKVVCQTKYLVHEQMDPDALSNWKSDYRGSSHALRKMGHIFRKFPWSCSKCHLRFVFSSEQEM